MLNPGTLLGVRYEIGDKIGQGGMSYVYRAQDKKLGRVVAIKILKEEFSGDEEFIRKFKNEAQAAARLSHPNIVGVYDVVDEGNLHYIVMELVEGITLKNYIARKKRLSNKETIGIALQAAEGIGEAHRKGIIHRDIKPQNMIISRDGKVKVADFGIARAVSGETIHAAVIGSVHYISPEQARSGTADVRSDIYSLGISMYEMITGRVPFEGDNTVSVVMAHLSEAMVPPSVYNKEIYPALNDIIMKACRKRSEERYQSAAELIADLKHCVREPDGHFVRYGETVPGDGTKEAAGTSGRKNIESGRKHAELEEGRRDGADRNRIDKNRTERNRTREAEATEAETEERDAQPEVRGQARRKGNVRDSAVFRKDIDAENGEKQDAPADQIQRLMKYGSFAAGAIILAVVLMIGANAAGLFNAFSPTEAESSSLAAGEETEDTETGEAESESVYQIDIQGETLMPSLVGMSVAEAEAKLSLMHISLDSSKTAFSDTYFEGLIIEQDPKAEETVIPGITVHVTVSLGNQITYTLAHLAGISTDEAKKMLSDAGIEVADVRSEPSETIEEGLVTGWQAADAGTDIKAGDSVVLTVSSGKPEVSLRVPSLHSLTQSAAENALKASGLSLGTVSTRNSDTAAGLVIAQQPEANQQAKPGQAVAIVLSAGPETSAAAPETTAAPQPAEPESAEPKAASQDSSKYYYGSIDTIARAGTASGPDSSETMNIEIRLMQRSSKSIEYITLEELKAVPAGTEFPVSYPSIQGIYGVTTGQIQIVNADTGETLKTFDISFGPR